jgi:hypothetical protein
MEQSNDASRRTIWGDGRIIFAAHAEKIRQLIVCGWSIRKIHQEYNDTLSGLSYQQLAYYLHKEKQKEQSQKISSTEQTIQKSPLAKSRDSEPVKRFKPGPRMPDPQQLY